ncbi:MAG: IS4 family transposase [Geothrix sp.]|nr:MAG: IS4 family transposase [Geothrix sp.]
MEWILQALGETCKTTIRRRRLPADIVVWIVICVSIFRSRSISGVVEALDLALPGGKNRFVSKSAIAQARQRVGVDPFRELFRQSARSWAANQSPDQDWKGLTLWVVDGTTLKTPDTPEMLEEFGAQSFASGKRSSNPQLRAVTLTSLPTRILVDAAFGRYNINEMRYVADLIPRIPGNSLTIFDKGFISASILLGLSTVGESRHFLIPARIDSRHVVISGTEKDALVEMTVSREARLKSPDLPKKWIARAIRTYDLDGNPRVLLTSLLDECKYPSQEICSLYTQRWEVETSYLEVKVRLFLNSLTLRSLTPEGIRQEVWGAFIGYNLLRLLMVESAALRGVSPKRLSFKKALELLQDELVIEAAAPGTTEILCGLIYHRRVQLSKELLPERKGRRFPRVIKSRPSKYDVRYSYIDSKESNQNRGSKTTRKK